MNIDDFKKCNKPKYQSQLFRFKSEILNLLSENYSHEKIQKFLQLEGIKTSRRNVTRFISSLQKVESQVTTTKELKNTTTVVEKIEHQKKPEPKQKASSMFLDSNIPNNEVVEPDYSKFKY